MNENQRTIEDLTIKEAKEKHDEYKQVRKQFNVQDTEIIENIKSNLFDRYKGKYVICRTRNEGINAGLVIEADETGVILEQARRLYYHKPSNKKLSWYEGVALEGLSDDSTIGASVEKIIVEDYSLTVCTDAAKKSIVEAITNEQNQSFNFS